jgi:uncharacterized delta-60 repeat protein
MSSTDSGIAPGDQTRVRRFDRVCDEFESAWRAGKVPQLEDFLSRVSEDVRLEIFVELLSLDLDYRFDRGLTSSADDYECRFPEFLQEIRAALARQGSTLNQGETTLSQRRLERQLPGRLGDYELLGEIGRGGMGVVFQARQISLDRIVALKVIRGDGFLLEEPVRRFQTEARAAARLQHPGIVQVHDVGSDGPYRFFSMEYVQGKTLSDVCNDGAVSAEQAARYLVSLAEAVNYAHEQGILHRDLKPSNVLVDTMGRLRIADFGLAKQLEESATETSMGRVLGTPGYMSPEQARGEPGLIDRRSDVYSLGAILYALLTGRPPFHGRSPIDTLVQVIHDPPCPPHERNPRVDRTLESICLKCLNKDPAARYSSAQALHGDLARFLAHEPVFVGAGKPEPAGRMPTHELRKPPRVSWTARQKLVAGLVATAALALAAMAIDYNRQNSNSAGSATASSAIPIAAETSRPTEPRPLYPGALDPTFGDEGLVRIELGRGGVREAFAVKVQPDGHIVTAGEVERSRATNSHYMAVSRLLPEGALDTSFFKSGKAIFWFGAFNDGLKGRSLFVQPDGKIVVGGYAEVSTVGYDFGVARFNVDGTLDPTFGGKGLVTTDVTGARSSHIQTLALQPDGKLVAVGNAHVDPTGTSFALVRYLPDGSLDQEFGRDGRVMVDLPGSQEHGADAAIQPDGKIVVFGFTEGEGEADVAVLRCLPDGAPDESFGEQGHVVLDFGQAHDVGNRLALQGSKIIIQVVSGTRHFLLRLDEDGSIDRSFGSNGDGQAPSDFPLVGFEMLPNGMIVTADPVRQRLAVYSADGVLEKSYGPDRGLGMVSGAANLLVHDMARAPDGKLLFCGCIDTGDGMTEWVVARLLGPPAADSTE